MSALDIGARVPSMTTDIAKPYDQDSEFEAVVDTDPLTTVTTLIGRVDAPDTPRRSRWFLEVSLDRDDGYQPEWGCDHARTLKAAHRKARKLARQMEEELEVEWQYGQ